MPSFSVRFPLPNFNRVHKERALYNEFRFHGLTSAAANRVHSRPSCWLNAFARDDAGNGRGEASLLAATKTSASARLLHGERLRSARIGNSRTQRWPCSSFCGGDELGWRSGDNRSHCQLTHAQRETFDLFIPSNILFFLSYIERWQRK